MEQPSNPFEARPADKRVYIEHEVLKNTVLRTAADSSATEAPGLYLLQCVKVLLQLCLSDLRHFVDKVLPIFQRVNFDFPTFREVLKSRTIAFR